MEIDPIILAKVQFTEQPIIGKHCRAGDAGQENRFLTNHEHSVPTLFGITCGKNNTIDIMTKAMRDQNLEEFPNDSILNKYGAKCVWVQGVTQVEQFWVALNSFFTYGLQPLPMHKMSQFNRKGKPIQRGTHPKTKLLHSRGWNQCRRCGKNLVHRGKPSGYRNTGDCECI